MDFGNCVNCNCKCFKGENCNESSAEDVNDRFRGNCRPLLTAAFGNVILFQNTTTEQPELPENRFKLCTTCTELLSKYIRSRKQFLQLCKPNSKVWTLKRNDAHQLSAKGVNSKITNIKPEDTFIIADSNDEETILPDQGNENEQVFNPVIDGLIKQESDLIDYKEQFIKLELEKLSYESLTKNIGSMTEKYSSEKSSLYKCLKCTRIFSEPEQLERHNSSVHTLTENNLKCTFCPKTFSVAWFLRNHLNAVHNGFEILHFCQICKDKFYSEKDLQEHGLKEHDIRKHPYKCLNCTESFINVSDLRVHLISTHKGTKEANAAESNIETLAKKKKEVTLNTKHCKFCGKTFPKLFRLKIHLGLKHANEVYDCEVCHKEFSGHKTMTQHREGHKSCPSCDMEFISYERMKYHFSRVHFITNDRPFECEICGQRYPIYDRLKNHYSWHVSISGPKHFCGICDKAFPLKGHLVQHLKQDHSEKRQDFKCRFCEHVFSNPSNLSNHLRFKHRKNLEVEWKFPCNVCGQKFPNIKSRSTHKRIHTFETKNKRSKEDIVLINGKVEVMSCYSSETFLFTCPICGKSCGCQTGFFRHLKRKHSLVGFADPNIKTSSIVKCPICDKSFTRKDLMDKHRRVVHKKSIAPGSSVPKCSQECECPHCGKIIRNGVQAFRVHVSRHEIFIVEDTLNNPNSEKDLHAFFNEEDKSFKCHVCERTFRKQSRFLSHVVQKSHHTKLIYKYNDDKQKKVSLPFKCHECPGLQYPTAELLRRHRASHRFRKDRIRNCSICNVTLKSLKYLKIHMQTQH